MKLRIEFPGSINNGSPRSAFWIKEGVKGPFAIVSPTRFPDVAKVMAGIKFSPFHQNFLVPGALYFFAAPVVDKNVFKEFIVPVEKFDLLETTHTDDLTSDLRYVGDRKGILDCVAKTDNGVQHFAVFKDPNILNQLGLSR